MPCSLFMSNTSLGLQRILLVFLFIHTFLEETGRWKKWGTDPGPGLSVTQTARFVFLASVQRCYLRREITSLQEKQTREDLSCYSFFIQPLGRLRATSKRFCRIKEVAMLSHRAFLLAPPELGLFCISLSSHRHLPQDRIVHVHSKPNTKLNAASCEYSLLCNPKKNQFWCKYFTCCV